MYEGARLRAINLERFRHSLLSSRLCRFLLRLGDAVWDIDEVRMDKKGLLFCQFAWCFLLRFTLASFRSFLIMYIRVISTSPWLLALPRACMLVTFNRSATPSVFFICLMRRLSISSACSPMSRRSLLSAPEKNRESHLAWPWDLREFTLSLP